MSKPSLHLQRTRAALPQTQGSILRRPQLACSGLRPMMILQVLQACNMRWTEDPARCFKKRGFNTMKTSGKSCQEVALSPINPHSANSEQSCLCQIQERPDGTHRCVCGTSPEESRIRSMKPEKSRPIRTPLDPKPSSCRGWRKVLKQEATGLVPHPLSR